MRSEKYYCKKCKAIFKEPKTYYERHGLECPPYEKIPVCALCESDDFLSFDTTVERMEIVEKFLYAILCFNRYLDSLHMVFGKNIDNNDLTDGIEIVAEIINELLDFLDVDMQRRILKMNCDRDLEKILMCLKGGL